MKMIWYLFAFVLGLSIAFAVNALLGWGTQYVLAAFGVHVGFGVFVVAWFLFGALVGVLRRKS